MDREEDFNLLGSLLQRDGGGDAEVTACLRSAGAAWQRLQATSFRWSCTSLRQKCRIYSTFVVSRLLYGAEVWPFSMHTLLPLFKFYNRCLRSIVRTIL